MGVSPSLLRMLLSRPSPIPETERENSLFKLRRETSFIPAVIYKLTRRGLPWRLSGKESTFQCRRHKFDSWSRKIPRASEQLSLCPQLLRPCSRAQEPRLPSPSTATTEACGPENRCPAAGGVTAVKSPCAATRAALFSETREKPTRQ